MTREEAIKHLSEWMDEKMWRCFGTIDREAIGMAIEALSLANLKEEFESAEYEDYEHATLVDIKEPLKVLVVRCKDCRHHGMSACPMWEGSITDDYMWCYFGERREPGK